MFGWCRTKAVGDTRGDTNGCPGSPAVGPGIRDEAAATLGVMNGMTNPDHPSAFLTVAEVAERLRCSEPTIRRRIRAGEIPAVKLGQGRSVIRVDAAELEDWLYQREDNR
jgi:excisionase family DNA binding protein